MKLSDTELRNLERYLSDTMTNEERIAFQGEIDASHKLQSFLKLYTDIDTIKDEKDWVLANEFDAHVLKLFKDPSTKKFEEQVKQIRKQRTEEKKSDKIETNKSFNYKRLIPFAIAACILFLFYFNLNQGRQSLPDLYEKYNDLEDLPSFVTKGVSDASRDLFKIEQLFTENKFKDAESLAESTMDKNQTIDSDLLIYKGVSELKQQKFNEAENSFKELINSESLDNHKGYWYLSLLYMAKDDLDNAKDTLLKIASNKSYFKNKTAKEILKKI